MSWRDCWCACHSLVPVDRMSDRVAAATACSECHDKHVQKYVKENARPEPRPDTSTAWNEQGDGEGRED